MNFKSMWLLETHHIHIRLWVHSWDGPHGSPRKQEDKDEIGHHVQELHLLPVTAVDWVNTHWQSKALFQNLEPSVDKNPQGRQLWNKRLELCLEGENMDLFLLRSLQTHHASTPSLIHAATHTHLPLPLKQTIPRDLEGDLRQDKKRESHRNPLCLGFKHIFKFSQH